MFFIYLFNPMVPGNLDHGEDVGSRCQCHGMPELSLHGPRSVLEHNPIPIEIFERLSLCIPIWIIRGDTLKPCCKHLGTACFPLVLSGKIEDQYMILRRGFADLVSTLGRKLQMVGLLGMSEDDAIEAIMVCKLCEYR